MELLDPNGKWPIRLFQMRWWTNWSLRIWRLSRWSNEFLMETPIRSKLCSELSKQFVSARPLQFSIEIGRHYRVLLKRLFSLDRYCLFDQYFLTIVVVFSSFKCTSRIKIKILIWRQTLSIRHCLLARMSVFGWTFKSAAISFKRHRCIQLLFGILRYWVWLGLFNR